jgi:UDP-N-acetylmuramoyl-tripeptide--D-alanyl-D-alanine ligase
MAAICIGRYFNVPDLLIKEAIEEYIPANNRSQLLKTTNNQIIIDAYNANPSSMKLAIDNFMELKGDPKLFILGDMLELGTESKKLHQEIINHLAKYEPKELILIGLEFSKCKIQKHWLRFETTEEAIKHLASNIIKNHHIILKGSRGMQLEKLIDKL